MKNEERLELLETVLDRLRRAAAGQLLVVEGQNDKSALRELGVGGEVVVIHRGKSLEDIIDDVAERAQGRTVMLLTDWDRTGGRLFRRLHDGLKARVTVDVDMRRQLARATHAIAVEDVPADLRGLRKTGKSHQG